MNHGLVNILVFHLPWYEKFSVVDFVMRNTRPDCPFY
jgi:hypothetical protein